MEERARFRGSFGRRSHPAPVQTAQQHPQHTQTSVQAAQPATHHRPKPKKLGFFFGRRWPLVVIVVLAVLIALLSYGYIHTKNELKNAKNPTVAGKTETEQIVASINKTLLLPTGETPTLATVNDVSKLKAQTFFKSAQNGDKVLIFTKAGRAVLYRPSTKQVIEYAPVNLGGANP